MKEKNHIDEVYRVVPARSKAIGPALLKHSRWLVFSFAFTLFLFSGYVPILARAAEDLDRHPIYSTYRFNRAARTIYFGVQPLAVPMGVIQEAMKHDAVLRQDLQKSGYDIVFYPFFKGPDINHFFRKGNLDVTMLGDMPAMVLAATADVRIVGIVKLGNASLITTNVYRQLSDLKGKRIGFAEGTSAHYGLLIALETAGMSEDDIQPVNMEVSDLPQALGDRKIEAFSAWEPTPSLAMAKDRTLVSLNSFLNTSYVVFGGRLVKEQPELAAAVMASYLRALRWMKTDEKNLAAAVAWNIGSAEQFLRKPFASSPDAVRSITTNDILKYASAPYIPEGEFKPNGFMYRAFDFAAKKNKLPPDASWRQVMKSLDTKVMNDVLTKPRKYRLDTFRYE